MGAALIGSLGESAFAQLVPDTTLGSENSTVTPLTPTIDQIDGGATRGANLFHSFQEFNIGSGRSVYFTNPVGIVNILTRVTGANPSNILGTLGSTGGNANLFLINPNGIIFGLNARLELGGSFVASTASSIKFADGTEFSATNPSAPPLLTISVPIGLQFNGTQGDIVVQTPVTEKAFTEVGDAGQLPDTAQAVNSATDGTSFNAISGNLDNANDIDLYQLFLTEGVPFRASTVNGSNVDTQLFLFDDSSLGLESNDDTVSANGARLLSRQSTVPSPSITPFTPAVSGTYYLGISSYYNNPRSPQGSIFDASGAKGPGSGLPLSEWDANNGSGSGTYTITLAPQAPLQVQPGKTLALVGGNVTIQESNLQALGGRVELGGVAGSGMVGLNVDGNNIALSFSEQLARADVSLRNGSGIYAIGANGSIKMLARNIDISRSVLEMAIPSPSRLPGTRSEDLELNATGSITISDNSILRNILFGQGSLGSINLTAGDLVSLDDSFVANIVGSTGVGNAGDINITTGSLFLTGLISRIYADTYGQGNAGSVNINARDTISLDSSGTFPSSGSEIRSLVYRGGIGNAGNINITTGALSLSNVELSSYTLEQGNAGSVNINARDIVSLTNSQLSSYTLEQGNAGSVNINAYNTISLDNSNVINLTGGINITTGSLSLTNGSSLYSDTFRQGNAGSVNINARDRVSLDGTSPIPTRFSYNPSTIFTRVFGASTVGQGGDVNITTGSLSLTNGGAVNTSTQGQGNAGRVTINARDSIQISGTASSYINGLGEVINRLPSGVTTSAESSSVGSGGDVIITTGSLSVFDSGRINTTAQGQGEAGNIQIQASDSVSFDGAEATSTLSTTGVGKGGDIEITARSLSLLNNAQLSGSTSGEGDAGNITVSADTVGLSSGGRLLTTTSSGSRAGDITVNTPDLQLSGATSGLFAETTSDANAGNLTIQPLGNGQSVRVNLQDGAQISASTEAGGNGGELTITAPESITLTGNGSVIAAETGGSGMGGNLNLQTGILNIQNQAQVTVSSSGAGSAGSLFVDANQIYLDNGGKIRADTSGGGGDINLRSSLILLRNGSSITTNATGSNIPGGDISIYTDNLVAVPSENSDISANSANFRGGNVTVRADGIFGIEFQEQLTPLSDITATGITSEFSGTVAIITPGIDPSRGLAELPTEVVDATGAISTGCRDVQGSSFIVTGRGGLPPTPQQALGDDPRWRDWRTPAGVSRQPNTPQYGTLPPSANPASTKSALVEATGWVTLPDGQVILTASAANVTSSNHWGQPVNCDGS
ncbi:filamentous hemagglutinin N-terminal domain-containing protein [Microcoleus sp. FACHB-SPT15]|nr:filamentous hemagglutinin N-terminal domain-containing protein [Microcoleus sp. FACHB-SPT15]